MKYIPTHTSNLRLELAGRFTIVDVRQPCESRVVYCLRDKSSRSVAQRKLSAARMHAIENPGVRTASRIRCRTTVICPNPIDPPIIGVGRRWGNSVVHDTRENTAMAACMRAL